MLVTQASDQFTALRGKQQSHITSGTSAAPDLATRERLLGEFARERWPGAPRPWPVPAPAKWCALSSAMASPCR